MPETPSAIPLRLEGVDQAYPIVHTRHPALSMDEWRRYARALIAAADPVRGVMTAQHGGYIRGLFCHWSECSLHHGDTLIVDNLTVMDLFYPNGAAQALIEAMEAMAGQFNCRAIRTLLPDQLPQALHGRLEAQGHRMSEVVLCKAMPHG